MPKDPFVHKPGQGPSSSDLTGERSDDEKSSSKQKKTKAAEPSNTPKGTPLQQKVNGNKSHFDGINKLMLYMSSKV